jgi:hypothetical protein
VIAVLGIVVLINWRFAETPYNCREAVSAAKWEFTSDGETSFADRLTEACTPRIFRALFL